MRRLGAILAQNRPWGDAQGKGGVNPSPKGKKGLNRTGSLNHPCPEGWWDFPNVCDVRNRRTSLACRTRSSNARSQQLCKLTFLGNETCGTCNMPDPLHLCRRSSNRAWSTCDPRQSPHHDVALSSRSVEEDCDLVAGNFPLTISQSIPPPERAGHRCSHGSTWHMVQASPCWQLLLVHCCFTSRNT